MAWYDSDKKTKADEVKAAYEDGQKTGSEGYSALSGPVNLSTTEHRENVCDAWYAGHKNGSKHQKS